MKLLKQVKHLKKGERYLIELAKNSPVLSNIKEYGKCIYDAYQRREILKISDEITNEASSFDDVESNASEIIEKAEVKLYNLSCCSIILSLQLFAFLRSPFEISFLINVDEITLFFFFNGFGLIIL